MNGLEQEVLKALANVKDPDLGRDIVSLGFVKNLNVNGDAARFTIELTTPACPVKDKLKEEAQTWVRRMVPALKRVDVDMTAQVRPTLGEKKSQMCPEVKNIIPIASGKGGVGKSTVTANLAIALSRMGASVGVMDADVYGPSIPMILGCSGAPRVVDNKIQPMEQYGLKIISFGFFIPAGDAVIWRGPMLHKTVQQFLGDVAWGPLDYLLVDLPPGTGDVQLSLCQTIPLTGAVVVSTPQDVALNVAQKAIYMFRKLNCPILGIVENMSGFVCDGCGKRHDIFGSGGARRACDRLAVPFLGEIPLDTEIRTASDQGQPVVLEGHPASEKSNVFRSVAQNLAAQVSIRLMQADAVPVKISF
ncbi:MAG: Mrp/NBP35 family ATP-binding protein [Nitrospirae bacterium]|nr:Mrp/NBP35 family ATP-binding protein [Nitrospirota bacterium]